MSESTRSCVIRKVSAELVLNSHEGCVNISFSISLSLLDDSLLPSFNHADSKQTNCLIYISLCFAVYLWCDRCEFVETKCKLGQEELIIQQQTQNLFLSEVTMKLQTELQLAEKNYVNPWCEDVSMRVQWAQ